MGEALFLGRHELVLDAKGRVTVPARHRETLQGLCGNQITLVRLPGQNCLTLYPRPVWNEVAAKLMALPNSAMGYRRQVFTSALEVEIDNASRVLLSAETRALVGIEREVVLAGVGSHLELWSAAAFEEEEARQQAAPPDAAVQNMVW